MKQFTINVHFDMVVTETVIAEDLESVKNIALINTCGRKLESEGECVRTDSCLVKKNDINLKRDEWFESLPIRELVSTEEFFHVWNDYKCINPQGFADVCEDIWHNGWDENDRWDFYNKYKDVFKKA